MVHYAVRRGAVVPRRFEVFLTNPSGRLLHSLCLNSSRHWMRVRREHGPIDRNCYDRAAAITFLSLLTSPLRAAESILYGSRIRSESLTQPPVFILGHWRTGTTYLHTLLAQDPSLGFVPLFQTLAPASFFTGRRTLQPLVALRAPKTRPMDEVPIHMEVAQEEEFAMAGLARQSFYLGFTFPKSMDTLFQKYVMFDNLSPDERAEWERSYLYLLKTASLHNGGKRLVIKNPVNTARIPALLQLFPDAKFIHIHRDPFEVYRSTLHLYRAVIQLLSLQGLEEDKNQRRVLEFYRKMMTRYMDDRDRIPSGNLTEVAYDDLVANPLETIEGVYSELGLPGWEEARTGIAEHVLAQRSYRPKQHTLSPDDIAAVEEQWGFALREWDYQAPVSEEVAAAGAVSDQ